MTFTVSALTIFGTIFHLRYFGQSNPWRMLNLTSYSQMPDVLKTASQPDLKIASNFQLRKNSGT